MIRIWLGIALLASSWLLGLDYYQSAHTPAWLVAVIAGTPVVGRCR